MSNKPMDIDVLERQLMSMDFATPPISRLWRPTSTHGPVFVRAALLAAAVLLLATGLVVAAGGFPNLDLLMGGLGCERPTCSEDFQVTSRISDYPADSFGYDVVVRDGITRERLAGIAAGLAGQHPTQRVIVWFFNENAGQERFAFPLMPSANEAAPPPVSTVAWIATFDYVRSYAEPLVRTGPAG